MSTHWELKAGPFSLELVLGREGKEREEKGREGNEEKGRDTRDLEEWKLIYLSNTLFKMRWKICI